MKKTEQPPSKNSKREICVQKMRVRNSLYRFHSPFTCHLLLVDQNIVDSIR